MRNLPGKIIKPHKYSWIWDQLEDLDGFLLKSMFGAKSVYIKGKIVLCLSAKAEPWNGLLLCTDKLHHADLMAQFPSLIPHPVLSKWLYLSENSQSFEKVVSSIIKSIRRSDLRIGVVPKKKGRLAPKSIKFGDKL